MEDMMRMRPSDLLTGMYLDEEEEEEGGHVTPAPVTR